MPKVSVIISTYNRPGRLKLAIESVLAQTFQDWELIIVNDGNIAAILLPDGKARPTILDEDIVNKLTGHYWEFHSISHFGNHSKPKNKGITVSTGELVCFLDDDNQFRPDHLQALVSAFDKDPELDIAYGDRWIIDEIGNIEPQIGVTSDFNPYILMRRNFIDTSDFMIKREKLMYLGGWNESEKRMLDWELMVRAVKAKMKFQRVRLILTDYYLHSGQLSYSTDGLKEDGTPTWSTFDCVIQQPWLGEVKEPKVAIYTLTYDRLEETKVAFESMYKTAGYKFDHYIVDNGSIDGTPKWLEENYKNLHLIVNTENKGISIASNQAVEAIKNIGGESYDIIMKIDNDCVFFTEGWLATMIKIWKSNRRFALSCYIQGLKDNPGGAPRYAMGKVCGEDIGMTKHLGGICHFVDASAYDNFRWDEDSFLHGVQDLEFSNYLNNNGWQMGYLENYFCNHGVDGTEGQMERYKGYFERRKSEKSTKYEPK